jgi:hypothetical protein
MPEILDFPQCLERFLCGYSAVRAAFLAVYRVDLPLALELVDSIDRDRLTALGDCFGDLPRNWVNIQPALTSNAAISSRRSNCQMLWIDRT